MISIPKSYLDELNSIPSREIPIGYTGIELYDSKEILQRQVGYSTDAVTGKALITGKKGDWQETWLVIGNEISLGDPLIIDLGDPKLPVFTAMHGQGDWQLEPIANSIQGFFQLLGHLSQISKGRENPVLFEENPIDKKTLVNSLQIANMLSGNNPDFWELLVKEASD